MYTCIYDTTNNTSNNANTQQPSTSGRGLGHGFPCPKRRHF